MVFQEKKHQNKSWRFSIFYMGVSENWGTPKSSILIWFSIINHPFWGTPILETPIYTRKFNSSPLKVIDGSYKTIRIPILLGFRPIFRGRLLLNFRGACFTQRVCVLWFPSFPPKKLAIYSVFSAVVPPVHGRVVSAVTAALAAIVATLKAHPLQRTSFAARNCQVDGGICDVHPSFRFLKAMWNKYYSTCNIIKVVNFLKCWSPS